MNLHEWITQRIGLADEAARAATPGPWEAEIHHHRRTGAATLFEVHPIAELEGNGDCGVRSAEDAKHIAAHDPATALRRCEADRRVLARHCQDMTWYYSPACDGCGRTGDMDDATTENINECPELLDLAHAHGITEEELAALDVPQTPSRPPGRPVAVQARMTAEQAPASLRGHP